MFLRPDEWYIDYVKSWSAFRNEAHFIYYEDLNKVVNPFK